MSTIMTVDYLCDRYEIPQLQEMMRRLEDDAVRHDIKWHTLSERATLMRELRNNVVEALTIKKVAEITASQAEKAGQ
jgi:hypothetical protein